MSTWPLKVLGATQLTGATGPLTLERKTAALLAYLALEGATPRSRLAGLLWPETSEKTARNNLSQLLRRLRGLTGEVLVTGGDLLGLSPELEVDAAAIKVAMFAGDYKKVIALSGELLPNDYDDLPDFADWLYAERESLAGLRSRALHAELNQLEEAGAYADALALSERLLALDPVAEEAHRRAMRLHYLAGDRTDALRA
nr:AfsR family transcriptional regulator [Deinococcota bacterium]